MKYGQGAIIPLLAQFTDTLPLEKCYIRAKASEFLHTMNTVTLNLSAIALTDEQFYRLCQTNETWKLERNAQGDLLIMPPIGGKSGKREADLITDVTNWNRQVKLGEVFSSSTIFKLPNGGYSATRKSKVKSLH